MLLDRAVQVASHLDRYEQIKQNADQAAQFNVRAQQFASLAERVAQVRLKLEAFRHAGIRLSFNFSDCAGYAGKAALLRTSLDEDLSAFNRSPFNIKHDFTARIAAIVDSAEKALAETWRSYIITRADYGSADVLDALGRVPDFRASIDRILSLRMQIAAIGETVPQGASQLKAALARADELIAEHNASWSEFAGSGISEAVVSFIRKAGNGMATLADATGEVHAWLAARKLLGSFRIRVG